MLVSSDSHQPIWKISLQSRPYADPIVDHERFYVFSQSGEAVAGRIETGNRIWTQKVPGPILGTPAISNDSIFVATQNGFVLCLQKENGATRWQTLLEDRFIAPLSTMNGAILLPSETGTLYALSAKDGSELWRVSGKKKFNARAVLSGKNIYLGCWQKEMLCLKQDGSENWKFTASEIITEDAIVVKNAVFFPAYDQFVYSLETQTGKLRWRHPADRPSNLVLFNEEIVFASGTDLLFVSPQSGNLLRRLKIGKLISRLYTNQATLYFISGDVYRVNPSNSTISVDYSCKAPNL